MLFGITNNQILNFDTLSQSESKQTTLSNTNTKNSIENSTSSNNTSSNKENNVISNNTSDSNSTSNDTVTTKSNVEKSEDTSNNTSTNTLNNTYSNTISSENIVSANISNSSNSINVTDFSSLKDGTYSGTGQGRNGNIEVSVVVKDGKVTSITIESSKEDASYFNRAKSTVINEIISSQSIDVKTVSGATMSSNGIIDAVANALRSIF